MSARRDEWIALMETRGRRREFNKLLTFRLEAAGLIGSSSERAEALKVALPDWSAHS